MDWVEFIVRMSLAGIVVLPAGLALLYAARRWSRGAASGLHGHSLGVAIGTLSAEGERSEPAVLVRQLTGSPDQGAGPQLG